MLNLPPEIVGRIAMFSSTSVMLTLSGNRANRAWIQSELDNRAAKQLMAYVLNPTSENIAKAKAMYAANPRILFIETQGVEPASGIQKYVNKTTGHPATRAVHRKIIGSPFQAALGAGDSELYKDMAKYFDKVENGVERGLQQLQERFPQGFAYPASDYNFGEIVTAITNDHMLIATNTQSQATKKILAEFRKYFLPKDINQSHHFNLNHFVKAFNVYNQQYHRWNWYQASLFWRQVIGYLERLIPVVDAQSLCQGLYHLVDQKQTQARSVILYNDPTHSFISYYPLNSNASGLGFDFGIEFYSEGCRTAERGTAGLGRGWAGGRSHGPFSLKNYAEQKHQSMTTFSNMLNSRLTEEPEETHSNQCPIL